MRFLPKSGTYLRKLRIAAQLSQMEVAEFVGVTAFHLSRVEHDHRSPSYALSQMIRVRCFLENKLPQEKMQRELRKILFERHPELARLGAD